MILLISLISLVVIGSVRGNSGCPFNHVAQPDLVSWPTNNEQLRQEAVEKMKKIDYKDVIHDLKTFMTDSKAEWPADYGNYGPFMVRLAWHNAGSYRSSDGRGGVDGARQRFEPERSWDDNTQLDKARALLWPIKMKYGAGLSWGDLIVLAGNAAIESMGGPVLGFCGGRIDDMDGEESVLLGPTPSQESYMPCATNGDCKEPLGASTLGLIYVNPEGFMGNPVPKLSVHEIRNVFGRMNMNDSETVSLIGGGHAFGKTHGACPTGPGPKPYEDPIHSWPGTCGSGKGEDTFTSGFEFPFTTHPTRWDNEYFQNLLNFTWQKWKGPGGHYQWQVTDPNPPVAPSASLNSTQPIGMLTSDVALVEDPEYLKLTKLYAGNMDTFDNHFKHAWYKLTTRDMGPHSRCLGDMVPPPQDWQYPLPQPPTDLADFDKVRTEIHAIMDNDLLTVEMFARLAWRCAATFRATDYLGGCNGARVRLSPQNEWTVNRNLDIPLKVLEPLKAMFGSGLSWSDLIVLAGNAALERTAGISLPFCGGRTDASQDNHASDHLQPRVTGRSTDSLATLKETIKLMGLTQREFAVLNAAGYAIGSSFKCQGIFCRRLGHAISVDAAIRQDTRLDNRFFVRLLEETWEDFTDPVNGEKLYKAVGKEEFMFTTDLYFRVDGELRVIAEEYYYNNAKFLQDVTVAWNKLMIADRFDGPAGNLCKP